MSEHKTIFITGAASGIGRAAAEYFTARGWYAGLFDIDSKGLSSLKNEIGEKNCMTADMDVTDIINVRKAVKLFTGKTGGRIDVLFNNAGFLRMGMIESVDIKDQSRIIDVNIKGVLNCINAAFPYLKNTPGARIINMSSASAVYGSPELAVYSASKFAVRALTEALNIEFAGHGIYVCDIMPAFVNTPMITDAGKQAYSISTMGVKLTAEDVAEVVWKASQKKKIHWLVGTELKIQSFLSWIFPYARRYGVKRLTMPRITD